ncbi:hypothetical protein ACQUWN_11640 [Rossellomorea aquimaris]|nr:hypothetical protein [Rossellomorea vietnamensis]
MESIFLLLQNLLFYGLGGVKPLSISAAMLLMARMVIVKHARGPAASRHC